MGRYETPEKDALKHKLCTKVNGAKFKELRFLLSQNKNLDMSRLLRNILYNRPIKVYTRDLTLDNLMEELTKLRAELNAIGVNINQITRKFNTFPDAQRKAFFGNSAFLAYQATQPKIDRILAIISKLGEKWLQG